MSIVTLDSGNSLVAQVWMLPGILKPGESFRINQDPPVTFRGIEFESGEGQERKTIQALLVESKTSSPDCHRAPELEMQRLNKLITRLSFGLLGPMHIVAARVVPSDLEVGTEVESMDFPGEPPGIAMFESRIGFAHTQLLDTSLLESSVAEYVEHAMSWFLLGLRATNPVQRFLFHWIGLEMLAPERTGPWRCASCNRTVDECPHCGKKTASVRAVKTMQDYLHGFLHVTKKDFSNLYKTRCKINHGGMGLSGKSLDEVSRHSFQVEQCLLLAIKKECGLAELGPPTIDRDGFTIQGSPALGRPIVIGRSTFYDTPGAHTSLSK